MKSQIGFHIQVLLIAKQLFTQFHVLPHSGPDRERDRDRILLINSDAIYIYKSGFRTDSGFKIPFVTFCFEILSVQINQAIK